MEVLKQLRKRFENVNNSVSRWAVGLMLAQLHKSVAI